MHLRSTHPLTQVMLVLEGSRGRGPEISPKSRNGSLNYSESKKTNLPPLVRKGLKHKNRVVGVYISNHCLGVFHFIFYCARNVPGRRRAIL